MKDQFLAHKSSGLNGTKDQMMFWSRIFYPNSFSLLQSLSSFLLPQPHTLEEDTLLVIFTLYLTDYRRQAAWLKEGEGWQNRAWLWDLGVRSEAEFSFHNSQWQISREIILRNISVVTWVLLDYTARLHWKRKCFKTDGVYFWNLWHLNGKKERKGRKRWRWAKQGVFPATKSPF